MAASTASASRAPYLRLLPSLETRLELQRQALEQHRSIEAHAEHLLECWMRRAATRRKARLAEPGLVAHPEGAVV